MNWKNVTIKQFQEASKVYDPESSDLTNLVNIASYFEQVDPDTYRAMSITEFNRHTDKFKFFNQLPAGKMLHKWDHAGREFSLETSLRKITAGQFIDMSTIASRHKGNEVQAMHMFVALFYHETGKGYDPEGFEERAEFIRNNMTVDIAYPVQDYFFEFWIAMQPPIQTFLRTKAAAEGIGLQIDGVGTQPLTGWQKVVSRYTDMLLAWVCESFLTICRFLLIKRSTRSN